MSQEILDQLYDYFLMYGKVTTDTRQCQPGNIFFALKGDNFDGNTFVPKAIEEGCSLAVTSNEQFKEMENVLYVSDTLKALQALARFHRDMLDIPIIGITGTNGKTTTKELVSAVLQRKYDIYYTQGNYNNHIGVPLTLLSMNNATEIGVVEMGANHIGEIAELCRICKPNFGIITNIGKAHLEGFGSYEGVITAKRELYTYIDDTGGQLFVNGNDPLLMELSKDMSRKTYGASSTSPCLVTAFDTEANPLLAFKLKNHLDDQTTTINTQLLGNYNIDNALAACCIGAYFNIESNEIKEALESYIPSNNRSQLVKTENNQVLMDAYNANPSSMKAAIDNFASILHPAKTLILGGMRELGNDSVKEHRNLVLQLQSHRFDSVYLVGSEFNAIELPSQYLCFPSTKELANYLSTNGIKNRFVMVKGSRSNKLEEIQPYL